MFSKNPLSCHLEELMIMPFLYSKESNQYLLGLTDILFIKKEEIEKIVKKLL
jgi:hypothetical protein